MKKIIAIDLDGTLLNSEGMVSKFTKDVLNNIVSKGHTVVIATGRTLKGAIDIYNEIGLESPLIVNNGASVYHPKDSNFETIVNTIDYLLINEVFNSVKEYILSAFYTLDEVTYAYNFNKRVVEDFNGSPSLKTIEGPLNSFKNNANLVVFLVKRSEVDSFESVIKTKFELLNFRTWERNDEFIVYEIYMNNISKYTGLLHVLDYYKIGIENLISFGDHTNDIDMLNNANPGITLANATESVKQYSTRTSLYSNNEDGVAIELIKIMGL